MRASHPVARLQNLDLPIRNRELRFATLDILISGAAGRQSCILVFVGQGEPSCPLYQGTGCRVAGAVRTQAMLVLSGPRLVPPFMSTSEDALVRRIAKAARTLSQQSRRVRLGVGDDAALSLPMPGCEAVLSCDWFLEGTHFLRKKHPPAAVGWKCLARALSDIAAMGAEPRYFLLNLALPEELTGRWLDDFLTGLIRGARRFHCSLAGGDTTCSEKVLIALTVAGEVTKGRAILRSGARPGDIIYVSGRLGEAQLGLEALLSKHPRRRWRSSALRKHLYPEPRIALGRELAQAGLATAMMDLSDGLSTDIARLCASSRAGARLDSRRLPLPRSSSANEACRSRDLALALHGGDDYELLFTVPPRHAKRLPRTLGGVAVTPIGEVTQNRSILLLDANGEPHPLSVGGWDSFRSASRTNR